MRYLYSSCFASFLFDGNFRLLDMRIFSDIYKSSMLLKNGKWLNDERELIAECKGNLVIFIGFKDEEIKGIRIEQDVCALSGISGSLRKNIMDYHSSNIRLTENDVNEAIQNRESLKNEFEERCRNLSFIAGKELGLKLVELSGSLKRLASMPSSRIQLIGAERAFFRHMKYRTGLPKHGIIYNHDIVLNSRDKGKAARLLADAIAIAARVDYFKGKFVGDKLKRELMEKTG